MRILIDECLPRKLKFELSEHEVRTVPEMGWASKKNGELLRLMSGKFDVFLTIDSNLKYQQQLGSLGLAFVVLTAHNNKLATLIPLMAQVREILRTVQPGEVVQVTAKSR
ncbi:MAG: hypothetical protein H7175_14375 [Burkholderiales bacterium]|nr:hypothetical protein [Anaerolineae bacterium]